jgi:hypothetical protein
MTLIDQLVQLFRRAELSVRGRQAAGLHLEHGAERGGIAMERGGFGGCTVAFGTQPDVCRLAGPIHRPREVHSFAEDLQLGFIDTP